MATQHHILIVDDEISICEALTTVLKEYKSSVAHSGEEALEIFKENPGINLVIQDIKLPGIDGLELMDRLLEINPEIVIIVTTAFSAWENATLALRKGAYDYIKKPFDNNDIRNSVRRGLERGKLKNDKGKTWELVGRSKEVQKIFSMVRRVAPTESTVLIQGDSGTGKELIAKAIHNNSLRHMGPFITVNCGAFTATLLESELFGHVRGAFTGADKNKQGLLDVADGGTFFLDEIGEMPLALQVKLLRLIEEKEFIPVGANKTTHVDVRFVCATNRSLQDEVKAGNFREDLYFRLNVIPIYLPSLSERADDVVLIAEHFVAVYCKQMNSNIETISPEVKAIFRAYPWPGNVRELQNTIQRALALAEPENTEIKVEDLEDRIRQVQVVQSSSSTLDIPEMGMDLPRHLEELEKMFIQKAIEMCSGNKTEAAKILNMKFRSICYKIDKYQIASN
jgi:DNA-binding NtrC family response regulator